MAPTLVPRRPVASDAQSSQRGRPLLFKPALLEVPARGLDWHRATGGAWRDLGLQDWRPANRVPGNHREPDRVASGGVPRRCPEEAAEEEHPPAQADTGIPAGVRRLQVGDRLCVRARVEHDSEVGRAHSPFGARPPRFTAARIARGDARTALPPHDQSCPSPSTGAWADGQSREPEPHTL